MNKISNHLLRSLNSSIPAGTECYLCDAVRRALLNYRNGFEPVRKIIDSSEAISLINYRLNRRALLNYRNGFEPVRKIIDSSEAISLINYRLNSGLKRFFKPTVQNQIET